MSRFVSGGAIDAVSGESVKPAPVQQNVNGNDASNTSKIGSNKAEWEAVEKELEEERRKRAEARRAAGTGEEKSLYDALQANKAAKQAAFEETHRLKNQFRALDDDEIDFLDSVRESSRAEQDRLRKETEQDLEEFHKAQKKGDGMASASAPGGADLNGLVDNASLGEEGWHVGSNRKRKRREDKTELLKGLRRKSSGAEPSTVVEKTKSSSQVAAKPETKPQPSPESKDEPATKKPTLGLSLDYGSDSD